MPPPPGQTVPGIITSTSYAFNNLFCITICHINSWRIFRISRQIISPIVRKLSLQRQLPRPLINDNILPRFDPFSQRRLHPLLPPRYLRLGHGEPHRFFERRSIKFPRRRRRHRGVHAIVVAGNPCERELGGCRGKESVYLSPKRRYCRVSYGQKHCFEKAYGGDGALCRERERGRAEGGKRGRRELEATFVSSVEVGRRS